MRQLFRLNVLKGSGKRADVPGYSVGGKTGTAEKVENGRYSGNKRRNAFLAAFPMDAPKYLVLVVLDEPKPEKPGMGATAGLNAAPTVGNIIRRIAPMLGIEPKAVDPGGRSGDGARLRAMRAARIGLSDERRYGPRRLASLLLQRRRASAGAGERLDPGADRRQPRGRPGMLFAALPGTKSDGAKFIPQAVEAGAAAILMGQQPLPGEYSDPGHPRRRSAPRAGADRGALLRAPAAHRRRRHRHQRQDLGHASSCARSGRRPATRRRASARSASIAPGGAVTGSLTTPDPIKLHEIMADLAGDDVTHLALEASSHGLEQRRLDGVRFAAGALHQPVARPPRLPRDAGGLSEGQAPAVRHAAAEGRRRGRRRRPAARRRRCSASPRTRELEYLSVGRERRDAEARLRHPHARRRRGCWSRRSARSATSRCRSSASSRSRTRWSPPASRSRPASRR